MSSPLRLLSKVGSGRLVDAGTTSQKETYGKDGILDSFMYVYARGVKARSVEWGQVWISFFFELVSQGRRRRRPVFLSQLI